MKLVSTLMFFAACVTVVICWCELKSHDYPGAAGAALVSVGWFMQSAALQIVDAIQEKKQ